LRETPAASADHLIGLDQTGDAGAVDVVDLGQVDDNVAVIGQTGQQLLSDVGTVLQVDFTPQRRYGGSVNSSNGQRRYHAMTLLNFKRLPTPSGGGRNATSSITERMK